MSCKPSRPLEPIYTHAMHFQACYDAAQKFQMVDQPVLVKRGLIVYCARIKHAYTVPNGGPDCWTVETSWPEKTRITVPVKNVIACNSDLCNCILRASSGSAQRPADVPKGLTCL